MFYCLLDLVYSIWDEKFPVSLNLVWQYSLPRSLKSLSLLIEQEINFLIIF